MMRTAIDIDYTLEEEETARYAKALGHPVRIRILQLLASRSCCYNGGLYRRDPITEHRQSAPESAQGGRPDSRREVTLLETEYCINKENWKHAQQLPRPAPLDHTNMKTIKVLGTGCAKCKSPSPLRKQQ